MQLDIRLGPNCNPHSQTLGKNGHMLNFDTLGKKKVVIGMVHLLPLPGTPFHQQGNMEQALDKGYPVGEITRDPFMQELKEDERFQRLLKDRGE